MKTAIEQLIEYIEEWQPKNKFTDPIWHKAKSLLETEKQQIIDFANKCQLVREVDCDENVIFSFRPEDIFESTFETEKETLK